MRKCIGFGKFEGKCPNDAGATHSPHWCQRCDDLRMAHLDTQFKDLAEGDPVPDSLPTTKRLLDTPNAPVGYEVVGRKIVERYDIPESITGEPGCQGLSDVARARNPKVAEKLCGLLNLGKEKFTFLDHIADAECQCDPSVGMEPCEACEAKHLIAATRSLSND